MDYLQLSPFTTANSHWLLRIIDGFSAQCPWLIAEPLMLYLTTTVSDPCSCNGDPRKAASWSEEHGSNHFHFCKMRGLNSSMAWKIKIQIRQNPFIKQILRRSCVCKTGPSGVNSGWGEAGKCRACSSQIRLWRTHSLSCWTRWSPSLIPVLQLQGSVIRLSRAPGQTKIAICLAFGVDVSKTFAIMLGSAINLGSEPPPRL